MDHPNAALVRRAYDSFAKGDIPTVVDMFASDITWHVPGRSPLSGDFRGAQEILGFFSKTMELSQGTFRIEIEDVLASGEVVVVLCRVSAERNGKSWSTPEVQVWRVVKGKIAAFREFQGDQQSEDEFWSS